MCGALCLMIDGLDILLCGWLYVAFTLCATCNTLYVYVCAVSCALCYVMCCGCGVGS